MGRELPAPFIPRHPDPKIRPRKRRDTRAHPRVPWVMPLMLMRMLFPASKIVSLRYHFSK
jgi:hypothetical protein